MAALLSIVALIMFHSSADSQTFTLVAKESAVSPSAKWFAPLVCWVEYWIVVVVEFFRVVSYDCKHLVLWLILLLKLEKIILSSS
jgi:hypothetical protein